MSAWRREAIARLPEFRQIIEAADRVVFAWTELTVQFERLYSEDVLNRDLISRFYAFARWCVQNPSTGTTAEHDPATAAVVAFYEDVSRCERARSELVSFITAEEFRNLQSAFRYHLSEAEFKELQEQFAARYGRRIIAR